MYAITLALMNYEAKFHSFPPAYVADKAGRPIHSWRVLILPFLGYDDLYKQYDFNEPWDGPNNRKLLAARPRVYACPSDKDIESADSSQTSYVAVVGPESAWLGDKSRKLSDLSLQTSTILLVETADTGIAWTEPRDISVDALKSASLGSPIVPASSGHGDYRGFFYSQRHFSGVNVTFADGHGQFLPPGALSPNLLPKLLKIGGVTDATYDEAAASDYCPPSWDDKPHINWTNCLALLVWLVSVGLLLLRAIQNRKPLAMKSASETVGERTTNQEIQKTQ
jgi:prepilin-type processing-associated H-X9-DG protein